LRGARHDRHGAHPQTLLARAIEALTAAARLTRTVGVGTDSERQEQADWAEFVTLAVAGAAANIGSAPQPDSEA